MPPPTTSAPRIAQLLGELSGGDVPAGGPIVLPGIDAIDVTAASTDVFALNHSEYAENNALLNDIGKLIESGLRPPDARLDKLKPVASANGSYWRYAAP